MFVSKAFWNDLVINFSQPLEIAGCDETNIFLIDYTRKIGGLPYIRIFSKEWSFVDAFTGCVIGFECATY